MRTTQILCVIPQGDPFSESYGATIEVHLRRYDGQETSRVLPMTADDFRERLARWDAGTLIQDAFPNLNASEREFLLTGLTDEEFDDAVGVPAGRGCGDPGGYCRACGFYFPLARLIGSDAKCPTCRARYGV